MSELAVVDTGTPTDHQSSGSGRSAARRRCGIARSTCLRRPIAACSSTTRSWRQPAARRPAVDRQARPRRACRPRPGRRRACAFRRSVARGDGLDVDRRDRARSELTASPCCARAWTWIRRRGTSGRRRCRADGTGAVAATIVTRSAVGGVRRRPRRRGCRLREDDRLDGRRELRRLLRGDRGHGPAPGAAQIEAATIVIAGTLDPATPPPHLEAVAAGIPGSRLELLEAAHFANWELAGDVNRLLATHFAERSDG